jgi:multicomponent Na+:H+ antiporter subunit E
MAAAGDLMLARQDFSIRASGVAPVRPSPGRDPAPQSAATPPTPRFGRVRRATLTGAWIAGLWAALHGVAEPASWVVGVPAVIAGGSVALLLPTDPPPHLSPRGALRFAGFAVRGVLRGAVDVALSALRPTGLAPGHVTLRTRLPEGRPRRLFAIAITMLPGTLTTRLEGDVLSVHALDLNGPVEAELRALEARIAGLYGLTLEGETG